MKELKKGKDMKKVKKGKIAHSGPHVDSPDSPWRREAKPDLSDVARVFGADLGSLEAVPMGREEAALVFQEQGVPVSYTASKPVDNGRCHPCSRMPHQRNRCDTRNILGDIRWVL